VIVAEPGRAFAGIPAPTVNCGPDVTPTRVVVPPASVNHMSTSVQRVPLNPRPLTVALDPAGPDVGRTWISDASGIEAFLCAGD